MLLPLLCVFLFFFFKATSTTEIYTLSLHDALPICVLHAVALAVPPQLGYCLYGAEARVRQKADAGHRETFKENTMRIAAGIVFAGTVSLLASSAAWSQTPPAAKSAVPQAVPAPAPAAAQQAPQPARAACTNPNALGVGRTVEIDTTGGPGFGFE